MIYCPGHPYFPRDKEEKSDTGCFAQRVSDWERHYSTEVSLCHNQGSRVVRGFSILKEIPVAGTQGLPAYSNVINNDD